MRRHARTKPILAAVAAAALAAVMPFVSASPAHAVTNPETVTMTATPNPVAPGQSITYNIVTTTNEPQQTNVTMSDQLNGVTNVVVDSSRGYCTVSNNLVNCSAGSIEGSGATWTVSITAQVTAASGTYLSNTATVAGNWSAQNTSQTFQVSAATNVQVTNQSTSPLPDLSVSVTGPGTAAPGATLSGSNALYLTVYNTGGANATDIQVNATLPSGFTLQPSSSVTGTSLFTCTTSLPYITCTGGAVNAGANAIINIPAVVSSTTPPPSGSLTYTTTAVVDPENAIPESNELNNTGQQTITVPASPPPSQPIVFTKTASSTVDPTGAQARPGDTLTYTITVKNTGTSTASNATRLQVTDQTQGLNQSAVTAKASDPKLICTNSNALVTCKASNNNYTLNYGATVTVTVSGQVVQPPSTVITNLANLQTLQNKVSINRNATVSTIVRPAVDLTVTQYATCTPPPPAPGAPSLLPCGPFRARNQFDYLITIGNSGLNDAGGTNTPPVTVREPLPNDVIFEGYSNLTPSGGFSCSVDTNNVVTCTGGTVPGAINGLSYQGTTRQIRLHLTAPDSIGPITATVTVDPYNTIPESDETNNTATTTTPIATGIDLTVTQSVRCPRDTRSAPLMCDPVAPSGTLIYDILVRNVGTQDASGITVSDILPQGARFRSAKEVPNVFGLPYTPPHGLSCNVNGSNSSEIDCAGGHLLGIYAAYGGPLLHTSGTPDNFTIEVTAFAPAPYGPNSSPSATGSPILNQVQVDPNNTISEYNKVNNLNILETNVGIPPLGDWGTYNELTVTNVQTNPVSGAVAPNGTLQYTLTVSNWGSDPVSNVTVSDYVPTGSRFRDVTAAPLSNGTGGFGCSFNNQNAAVVTCTNGALAASPSVGTPTSTTITILLFAPPTPNATTNQYTNHAVVDPNNTVPEADETNNVSDVPLVVALPSAGGQNAYNEFTVDNVQTNPVDGSGNALPVAPYGTLEYTLTAHNTGSDPAFGVSVYDYLPNGAQFRNVTVQPLGGGSGGFVCNYSSGLVSCNSGTIAAGSTAWIKILLFAPGTPNSATSQYTNHAVINPNNTIPEADVTNDATDTPLTVAYPSGGGQNAYNEFTITSAQNFPTSSGAVAPNGTVVYRLTIPNTGSDPAVNVPVRDYLPTGTTYRWAGLNTVLSTGGVTGFVCSQNNGVVDCVNGYLPAGGQAVIDLVLFAPNQPSSPGSQATITNQALVNPNQTVQEADPTNDTSTTNTTVSVGGAGSYWDLTTSLSGSDTTGQPDQPIHYTLGVQNHGTDDLFNATVSDNLPAGTTFVSAVDASPGGSAFTCTASGQVVTCTGGTIQGTVSNGGSPGSRTINIVANAPHANGAIVDQATADPNNAVPEADETNNSSTVSTDVESVIDLSVLLDGDTTQGGGGSAPSIAQGTTGNITGHITNTAAGGGSGATAQNVQTIWNLPISVTVLDVQAPAGTSCSNTQNPVNQFVCTTPSISAGQTLDFTFNVYNNSSTTLNDNASINADNKTVESDASNDTNDVTNSTVTN